MYKSRKKKEEERLFDVTSLEANCFLDDIFFVQFFLSFLQ